MGVDVSRYLGESRCDLSDYYCPYDWSRHIEPPYSNLDHYIDCKLFNGLDDFKVALYVCPNHRDNEIHSLS